MQKLPMDVNYYHGPFQRNIVNTTRFLIRAYNLKSIYKNSFPDKWN